MNLSDTDQAPYSAPAPQTATVSDEAVQAALDKCENVDWVQGLVGTGLSGREVIESALTAALPHLAISAAPCAVEVRELEFVTVCEYGLEYRVRTSIGIYSIHTDEDSAGGRMFCYFHLTDEADCTVYGEEIYSGYGGDDEAKAAAQADFERRILSQIVTKPVDAAAVRRQALSALEELANVKMDLSLEDWSRISSVIIRALSAEPAQGEQWQPIETAPKDEVVLMAWNYQGNWEYEASLYGSTRGGWLHGQSTHWMPLPTVPASKGASK